MYFGCWLLSRTRSDFVCCSSAASGVCFKCWWSHSAVILSHTTGAKSTCGSAGDNKRKNSSCVGQRVTILVSRSSRELS